MSKLASSSQTQLRYAVETVWGVAPTTGNSRNLRMTGESLSYNITKDESNEIEASRQTRSLSVTNVEALGAVNFELSYKEYDEFLSGLMRSAWQEYATLTEVPGAVDVTSPDYDTFTATAAPAGAEAFTKLKSGDYIKVTGTHASLKPGFHQIVADPTATEIRVAKGLASAAIASIPLNISSARLVVGDQDKSFTLEKQFQNNQFFSYTGMLVSKMDLSLQDRARLTGSFDFIGKKGARTDLTRLPGTPTPSHNFDTMSSVTGVKDVRLGGVPIKELYETYVRELTLSVDNQLEALTGLGEEGAVDVIAKKIMISGGMQIYLRNGALYDRYLKGETDNFSFTVTDPEGNGYAFVFDRIDWSSMTVQAGGDGQAVMLDTQYRGLQGKISNNSLTIYRL